MPPQSSELVHSDLALTIKNCAEQPESQRQSPMTEKPVQHTRLEPEAKDGPSHYTRLSDESPAVHLGQFLFTGPLLKRD